MSTSTDTARQSPASTVLAAAAGEVAGLTGLYGPMADLGLETAAGTAEGELSAELVDTSSRTVPSGDGPGRTATNIIFRLWENSLVR